MLLGAGFGHGSGVLAAWGDAFGKVASEKVPVENEDLSAEKCYNFSCLVRCLESADAPSVVVLFSLALVRNTGSVFHTLVDIAPKKDADICLCLACSIDNVIVASWEFVPPNAVPPVPQVLQRDCFFDDSGIYCDHGDHASHGVCRVWNGNFLTGNEEKDLLRVES